MGGLGCSADAIHYCIRYFPFSAKILVYVIQRRRALDQGTRHFSAPYRRQYPGTDMSGFFTRTSTPILRAMMARITLSRCALLAFLIALYCLITFINFQLMRSDCSNSFLVPSPFSPPEPTRVFDTFTSYKWRNQSQCQISSLDLHTPFSPLCPDRRSFLTAYTSGGRIGKNAPFMPRGCDMHWYRTEKVCEILGRFEKVIVLGDSMMRHVVGAINVLVREDLGYGAVTDWNFRQEERYAVIIYSHMRWLTD